MIDTEYRRYTTAELAAMPETARMLGEWGGFKCEWVPFTGPRQRGWAVAWSQNSFYVDSYEMNSRLARRKLRRIA